MRHPERIADPRGNGGTARTRSRNRSPAASTPKRFATCSATRSTRSSAPPSTRPTNPSAGLGEGVVKAPRLDRAPIVAMRLIERSRSRTNIGRAVRRKFALIVRLPEQLVANTTEISQFVMCSPRCLADLAAVRFLDDEGGSHQDRRDEDGNLERRSTRSARSVATAVFDENARRPRRPSGIIAACRSASIAENRSVAVSGSGCRSRARVSGIAAGVARRGSARAGSAARSASPAAFPTCFVAVADR